MEDFMSRKSSIAFRLGVTSLALVFFFIGIVANVGASGKSEQQYTVGYVQAGPSIYWQLSAEGCVAAGKLANINVIVLSSDGKPDKELANIEDFIAKKVDAIMVFTTNGETAQQGAKLANDAKIPFFLVGSAAADGPGKPTSTIKGDFEVMGRQIGSYVAKHFPNTKAGIVSGPFGQGIAEPFIKGFKFAIKDANVPVVAELQADVGWTRASAMAITQNMITAHPDINLMYVMWEDGCAGSVQALKEAGMLDKVNVITHNGQPLGVDMLKKGEIKALQANSPTNEAGVAMIAVYKYLHGQKIPALIETPSRMIDSTNLQDVYGWELNAATDAMKEFLEKGTIRGYGKDFTF
jgi:ribose transport system substrate-binding protein